MDILTFIICFVGIYLVGYVNHCAEVRRNMEYWEQEAKEMDFHRTEKNIRKLHDEGHVFGGDK